MAPANFFKDIYTLYTAKERRNIAVYILGIMLYKFGLECVGISTAFLTCLLTSPTAEQFNGSITTLATDRFNASKAFEKVGILQGLNQAMQCVGAILIAPLIKRFNTRSVLASAILAFGLLTAILLIADGM